MPTTKGECADFRHLSFQIKDSSRHAFQKLLTGFFEVHAFQVVPGQRHGPGCERSERRIRFGRPSTDIGKEHAHVEKPGMRRNTRRGFIMFSSASQLASSLDSMGNKCAPMDGKHFGATGDFGVSVSYET